MDDKYTELALKALNELEELVNKKCKPKLADKLLGARRGLGRSRGFRRLHGGSL
jgi:hypothetical protein